MNELNGATASKTAVAPDRLTAEMADFDGAIAERKVEIGRIERRRRKATSAAVAIGLLLVIAFSVYRMVFEPASQTGSMFQQWNSLVNSPIGGIAALIVGLVGIVAKLRFTQAESNLTAEIELLEEKKRIAVRLTGGVSGAKEQQQPSSYFDSLVKINVDNLAEYYSLVKVHTNNSFRSSLLAGGVGFILICAGVVLSLAHSQSTTPAVIASLAGVLTEFIAGVFFYLYNRTVRQLKEYHDSLLAVQNVLLALKLVSDTQDEEAKRHMTDRMCSFLLAGLRGEKLVVAGSNDAENPVTTRPARKQATRKTPGSTANPNQPTT